MITIYTDGSSLGNPGPAGWAVLIDGVLHSGSLEHATSNWAELYAVLKAVELCPGQSRVVIHTDSKMVVGWLAESKGMRNKDLIALAKAYFTTVEAKRIAVTFKRVRGHSGDPNNDLVDKEARHQARMARNELLAK